MHAAPLKVGRETIQPSPKVIVSVEFTRCTLGILGGQPGFLRIQIGLTRYLMTAFVSRSNLSARVFKTDRVLRGSNARKEDSGSLSPPRLSWTSHVSGWLSNSRGRIEMKDPNCLSVDSFESSRGLCR